MSLRFHFGNVNKEPEVSLIPRFRSDSAWISIGTSSARDPFLALDIDDARSVMQQLIKIFEEIDQ